MAADIVDVNRKFYDAFWWKARLHQPERFNTWPFISQLLPRAASRIELGPGLRPRLPIAGTRFIDISEPVVTQLNARHGIATLGEIGVLPFGDREFDLVCAFDVIEHVADDRLVFSELSRVLKDDGVLIFSVPLHPERWTTFDTIVGHARRYEPAQLTAILAENRLAIDKTAVYGLQPSNSRWVDWGMWYLEHRRNWAMFWYNWIVMPLAMRFQKPVEFVPGFVDAAGVEEVLVVCRRAGIQPAPIL